MPFPCSQGYYGRLEGFLAALVDWIRVDGIPTAQLPLDDAVMLLAPGGGGSLPILEMKIRALLRAIETPTLMILGGVRHPKQGCDT